jgi:nitrite reductase/ring-hydroxylating ferredoxin subunit
MVIDNFVPSIDETELKNGTMKLVNVAGKEILLARIGSEVFGISNVCPCKKCDLSKGKLEGYIVTCPCHGWKFDVRTGEYLKTKRKLLSTYKCKVSNGKIFVEIF